MVNLFQLAEANIARLEEAYGEVLDSSGEARETLDRFADGVRRDGRVSINMRLYVLASLVAHGRHLNAYEWAEEQSALSGRDKDAVLQHKLGAWYGKRVAFDAFFEDGEAFRYGALNTGGLGAERYGPFCTVLPESFGTSGAVAYLRGDSLKNYVSEAGAVDEEAIEGDAAPHSHRGELAALKHAEDLPATDDGEWPELLCSDSDFVEAIFTEAVELSCVDRVRVSHAKYQDLYWLAFNSYDVGLKEGERALGADFVAIRQAERDGRIRLEVL